MRLFPVIGSTNRTPWLMMPFDLVLSPPVRRVVKWYESIRPSISWILRGPSCQ